MTLIHRQLKLEQAFSLSIRQARLLTRLEHRANPFINILNMTVKSIAQYPDLTGVKGLWWRLFNSVAGTGVTIVRAIFYWPHALPLPKINRLLDEGPHERVPVDVVIISHLTSLTHFSADEDFYFGGVEQALNDKGISTYTLMINHCRANRYNLPSSPRTNTSILPAFLSPWGELKLVWRSLVAAAALPRLGSSQYETVFHRHARIAQLSSRALGDLRIGSMVADVVDKLAPRAILYTFEGHGWERVMAVRAHQMKTPCHIMGYQHAVVFPGKKSLSYKHGQGADPDYIFTVGHITCNDLQRHSDYTDISVLGSVKAVEASSSSPEFKADGACLFAPEGTLSEVEIMAAIAIDAATANPTQEFILRLHPVLSRQQVVRNLARRAPFPENFSISSACVQDDFARSSWLCYRGSTLAFQGLLAGLRPVYLNPDDMVNTNDPMPSGVTFRRVANNSLDLLEIIAADQTDPEHSNEELGLALVFARNYIVPIDFDVLIRHLKARLP